MPEDSYWEGCLVMLDSRQMSRILIFVLSLILIGYSQDAANAAASKWQDLGGGKARLLAVLDPTSGKVKAAVEVKLEPGWTTYWRYPGSSGIPPVFDFSGSNGFTAGPVAFPAPRLLGNEQLRYAGYKGTVAFPLDGQSFQGVETEINLDLLIGVCAEICIPAQARMKITSDELANSDPFANQIIWTAEKQIPRKVKPDEMPVSKEMDGDDNLIISVNYKDLGDKPALFVEGPPEWYLQPASLIARENNQGIFALDVSNAPEGSDILAEELVFTLVDGPNSVEFAR